MFNEATMRRLCERLQAGQVLFDPEPFGQAVPRAAEPSAGHLIPLRRIVQMPGFVDLDRDAQQAIVDGDDNVIAATREENFSRLDRPYAEYQGLDARALGPLQSAAPPQVIFEKTRPLGPGAVPAGLVEQLRTPTYGGVELIAADELTDSQRHALPLWWLEVTQLSGPDSVRRAADEWRRVVVDRLPAFLDRLENQGAGVFLGVRPSGEPLLVYAVAPAQPDDPFSCWYGHLPVQAQSHHRVDLTRLPAELVGIHTALHDRFRNGIAVDNGLLPLSELFTAGQFRSTTMEFDDLDYVPDLENIVAFFLGFGTEAVCAELSVQPDGPLGWQWFEASFSPFELWVLLDYKMAASID
jgi:hypothetical protein